MKETPLEVTFSYSQLDQLIQAIEFALKQIEG